MTVMDSEHVFYCTGALIVNTYSADYYNLWLLDFSNDQKLADWRAGSPIPAAECVRVNRTYTMATPGPNGEIHVATSALLNLSTLDDITRGFTLPARLAIHATLWDKIPVADRPLPPPQQNREQDYRIKVILRRDASGSIRGYLGFHVKVLATDGALSRVQFFSWTGDKLGAPLVDLATSDFDPITRGHSTIGSNSEAADEGALFVSFQYINACGFLVVPKVPYGAQSIDAAGSVSAHEPAGPKDRSRPTMAMASERRASGEAPIARLDQASGSCPACGDGALRKDRAPNGHTPEQPSTAGEV